MTAARRWLDLDAAPQTVDAALAGLPGDAGLRLPGSLDAFELAVRAVLGQQITVAAARTVARRVVERFGAPLATPWPDVNRSFPAPAELAGATIASIAELGIIRTRASAIIALAQAWPELEVLIAARPPADRLIERLCALPGIGPWTAHYIAMRALSWPDAFPPNDVAVLKAMQRLFGTPDAALRQRAADTLAEPCDPGALTPCCACGTAWRHRHEGIDMSLANDTVRQRCTAQLTIVSPLGPLLLARTADGLAGAWFEGQKDHPGALHAPESPDDALLRLAAAQIAGYFAGERACFELPLDLHGTAFQRGVWAALLGIAAGQTRSYGDIARDVGSPAAVRAVGAAVGKNPLSVIVPCHRVLGANGALTGYAGGIERKVALLRLEGALL